MRWFKDPPAGKNVRDCGVDNTRKELANVGIYVGMEKYFQCDEVEKKGAQKYQYESHQL